LREILVCEAIPSLEGEGETSNCVTPNHDKNTTTARRWIMGQNVKFEFVSEPKEYVLRIDKALEMPLGLEYVVTVASGGSEFEACIPASNILAPTVDGDPESVYGKCV